MLTHSTPIESQFMVQLIDNLNAEVVLGTVTNVREGVSWLNSTYLALRLQRNPLAYGLTLDDLAMDPGADSECGHALMAFCIRHARASWTLRACPGTCNRKSDCMVHVQSLHVFTSTGPVSLRTCPATHRCLSCIEFA